MAAASLRVMLSIAGTANREHFDANLAATTVHLTDDEVRTITNLVPDPAGTRWDKPKRVSRRRVDKART